MNNLSFKTNFTDSFNTGNDVLSAFKERSQKPLEIQQGMSVGEISDVVSDKIIAVVEKQFLATKEQFLGKAKI
jgi:hypothetical protein